MDFNLMKKSFALLLIYSFITHHQMNKDGILVSTLINIKIYVFKHKLFHTKKHTRATTSYANISQ